MFQAAFKHRKSSLKPKMERQLATNTSNIALLICQDVGEPPTLHRLQVLQRFQPENQNRLLLSQTIFSGVLKSMLA